MANRVYELLIAFDLSVNVADADALLGRLTGLVGEAKGAIKAVEKLGQRRLAFKVHARSEAQFVLLTLEMPATTVPALENVLRLHEGVLRYMTTRLDPSLLAASAPPPAQAAPAPAPTPPAA